MVVAWSNETLMTSSEEQPSGLDLEEWLEATWLDHSV